eukprot:1148038-Pelagomonas_calceolata.AAC.5
MHTPAPLSHPNTPTAPIANFSSAPLSHTPPPTAALAHLTPAPLSHPALPAAPLVHPALPAVRQKNSNVHQASGATQGGPAPATPLRLHHLAAPNTDSNAASAAAAAAAPIKAAVATVNFESRAAGPCSTPISGSTINPVYASDVFPAHDASVTVPAKQPLEACPPTPPIKPSYTVEEPDGKDKGVEVDPPAQGKR